MKDSSIIIKKRFTYKRDSRSKVLTIFATQVDANKIDKSLCKIILLKYRYLLFRKATLEESLAAMYQNEVKYIRSRYKKLYDVKLKDKV